MIALLLCKNGGEINHHVKQTWYLTSVNVVQCGYRSAFGSMMAGVPVGGGRMSLSSMPPAAMGIFPAIEV